MDTRNNKKLILRKLLKKDKIGVPTVQITKKLENSLGGKCDKTLEKSQSHEN